MGSKPTGRTIIKVFMRGMSEADDWAHNPGDEGSSPSPATILEGVKGNRKLDQANLEGAIPSL